MTTAWEILPDSKLGSSAFQSLEKQVNSGRRKSIMIL
jgi:hypothetical protein